MAAEYDVSFSHARENDGVRLRQIANAPIKAGLRVWFDANEMSGFTSIAHAINDLTKSKSLLAYYSKSHPMRRTCGREVCGMKCPLPPTTAGNMFAPMMARLMTFIPSGRLPGAAQNQSVPPVSSDVWWGRGKLNRRCTQATRKLAELVHREKQALY